MENTLEQKIILTIVSVDMVGSTEAVLGHLPDEVQELLDENLTWIEKLVSHHGGTVFSFTGDGALASFGWPISLADHADRACLAAWDIQHSQSSEQNTHAALRVGVCSGLVGVRKVRFGNSDRLDVVGAPVHMASAMQKSARVGGVLVAEDTLVLCRNHVRADQTDDVVAGKGRICRAAHLIRRPQEVSMEAQLQPSVPMVGRDVEFEQLRDKLPKEGAAGNSVLIMGEPGIGKSRLAHEVMSLAQKLGLRDVIVRSDPLKRNAPRSLVAVLLKILLPDDEAQARHEIEKSFARRGLDLDLVDVVLGLTLSAPARAANNAQLRRAIVAVLAHALSGSASIVLVEDIHWADPESIDCLSDVLAEVAKLPTLLMLTARPEADAIAEILGAPVLDLRPLSPKDMQSLSSFILPDGLLHEEERQTAITRADGVPFLLEQILAFQHLDQTGVHGPAPITIESLVHARANALPKREHDVLLGLSLLGETVEYTVAYEVLGDTHEAFRQILQRFEQLVFIHPGWEETIRFRHAIIAECCATMPARDATRRIHGKAASALIESYGEAFEHLTRIAHHAVGSDNRSLALDYYAKAARHARRTSARQSLKAIFDEVILLVDLSRPEDEDRFVDMVLMSFDALHQIGELPRILPMLTKAIDITRRKKQLDKTSIALSHLGMASWLEARYEDGLAHAQEALDLARSLNALPLIHYAQHTLAALTHMSGRVHEAVKLMRELCDLLSGDLLTAHLGGAGIPGVMSRAFLAEFLTETGDLDEAVLLARQALALSIEEKEPFTEVMSRIGLGRALLFHGSLEEAVDILGTAKQQLEDFGFWPSDPTVSGYYAAALARIGRGDEALAVSQGVIDKKRLTTPKATFVLWFGHMEAIHAVHGLERGLEAADYAIDLARTYREPFNLAHALGIRAYFLAQNQPDDPEIAALIAEQAELIKKYRFRPLTPVGPASTLARTSLADQS